MMNRSSMNSKSPFVASGFCTEWPCLSWTHTKLADILLGNKFTCRVSEITCGRTLETECVHLEISMEDFNNWLLDKAEQSSPLKDFPRSRYCCYIDYKYMKDMFIDKPDVFDQVVWGTLGFPEFNGSDSTIWIGSEGANTPCHQDTYGFNLVTQIHGKKLWILFPPEDTHFLYPSRIPYEESSIFSAVNIRNPNLSTYPLFKNCHPVIVVLNPGQTLYVPRHWWHYVQSLEPSISVNVWVPAYGDKESRYHEAITRTLASSLIRDFTDLVSEGNESLLNPTETLTESSINLKFLKTSLLQFLKDKESQTAGGKTFSESKECESIKTLVVTDTKSDSEDTDYLHKFASALEGYPVFRVSSPFDLDSLIRKLPVPVSSTPGVKKQKLCSDREYGNDYGKRESGMLEEVIQFTDEGSSKRLFSLSGCSVQVYLKYLKDLCGKSYCSCLSNLKKPQDNLGNVDISSGSPQKPLEGEIYLSSISETYPPATFRETSSTDSVASSKSHPPIIPIMEQEVSGSNNITRSTSVNYKLDTIMSKEEDYDFDKLTQRDVSEAFLNSILHPDIVQAVSVKMKEQCKIIMKKKTKKNP